MKAQFNLLLLLAVLFLTHPLFSSTLRFANSFGSSMVLQRDRPVPVWGWSTPGSSVSVSFKTQTKTTQSDADGRWMVNLDALSADTVAQTLVATSGAEQVSISNLLVGDVWIYTGPGFLRPIHKVTNSSTEVSAAKYPNIRVLRPDMHNSLLPLADIPAPATWLPIAPENMSKISIPWYLARELFLSNRIPVGLILSNAIDDAPNTWLKYQRGTTSSQIADLQQVSNYLPGDVARAEKWLYNMEHRSTNDPIDLLLFPYYIPYDFYGINPLTNLPVSVKYPNSTNFNSLIHPLIPMAIKGVVLSSDYTSTSTNYMAATDIQDIVTGWRAAWGRPSLPFLITQPTTAGLYDAKIKAAVNTAAFLPGVATLAAPVTFSDMASQSYWHDVATAVQTMTFDLPATEVPALSTWAAATTLNTTATPTARPFEMGHLFCDNMVLQCDQPIKVWGWAEPGTAVTVSLDGSTQQGTSNSSGRWDVVFPAKVASFTPLQMTVSGGGNSLTINNILMGEVWINSGQSNSGFLMNGTLDFAVDKPLSNVPSIRFFQNTKACNILQQRNNIGLWRVLSTVSVDSMSGIGYYFSRFINQYKNVPVGIIEANMGGSSIVAWLSDSAYTMSPKFASLAGYRATIKAESQNVLPLLQQSVRTWLDETKKNAALDRPVMPFPIDANTVRPFYSAYLQNDISRRGSYLYNAMIYPMIGYGVKGVLWNQGEADYPDATHLPIYDEMLAAMIKDWRSSWGNNMSFYFVQMPAMAVGNSGLLEMWSKQTKALSLIPNSGISVSNDISEPERGTSGIHPRNKKDAGRRLARLALARTYGLNVLVESSPLMKSAKVSGSNVIVKFNYAGTGLKTRDGLTSDSWEIAGADGKFVAATATLGADSAIVTAATVSVPAQVRLGWSPTSNCNLINSDSLPALPFLLDYIPGDANPAPQGIPWTGTIWTGFAGGNGTIDYPFLIGSGEELAYLAQQANVAKTNTLGKYYKIIADIDLNKYAWTPIGTSTQPFAGILDADNHKISNLSISNTTADYQALFGYVQGTSTASPSIIKNLTLSSGTISAHSYVGALVGRGNFVQLLNCKNAVNVTGNTSAIGGIAGALGSVDIVEGCSNSGTIIGSASASLVGGIVGNAIVSNAATDYSFIRTCENTGMVTATANVGGIAGTSSGNMTIKECYNTAQITGSNTGAGGIVGYGYSLLNILNCYNTGAIRQTANYTSGTMYAGGILGYPGINAAGKYFSSITNCYNIGAVTGYGTTSVKEGVAGSLSGGALANGSGAVANSYYLSTLTVTNLNGGVSKLSTEMQNPSFVALLNNGQSTAVWLPGGTQNAGYPIFARQSTGTLTGNVEASENPYAKVSAKDKRIIIDFSNLTESTVSIYNITGKLIYQQKCSSSRLSVPVLNNGMYIVNVSDQEHSFVGKVIVY